MSIASPEAETLTMKQRVFIGVLGVLCVVLAALMVFYFSPAGETSEALPGHHRATGSGNSQAMALAQSVVHLMPSGDAAAVCAEE
jgi:hypothetical protein